jgi:hypothetical protein
MIRVGDSPSVFQLSTINPNTGTITTVGNETARVELPGGPTSGMSGIYNNVFYFMGDSSHGTTKIVGLRLKDSTELCTTEIPELSEVAFVGAGQTLDVDWGTGNLIATGPGSDDKKVHISFTIDPVSCAYKPLTNTNTGSTISYENADSLPIVHGNTIQQGVLYTTVSDDETGKVGIEVVDITGSGTTDPYIGLDYTSKSTFGLHYIPDGGGEKGEDSQLVGMSLDTTMGLVVEGIVGLTTDPTNPNPTTSWNTVKSKCQKSKK